MKKYLYIFLTFAFGGALASCQKAEEGTEPGTTSDPTAVVFAYAADDDSHNPDSDLRLRIATNDKAQKVYVFYEDTLSYQSNLASMGKDGYADYVVKNGTEVSGAVANSVTESYITGLNGFYDLSVAAVSGGKATVKTIRVFGVIWEDICEGTYRVQYSKRPLAPIMGGFEFPTTFQHNPIFPNQYRYKDVFGKGYHVILNLTGDEGEDDMGVYKCFSINGCPTGFEYSNYGMIFVSTYADYNGDPSYYDNTNLYENNSMYSYNTYHVEAGPLVNGYDAFRPAQ